MQLDENATKKMKTSIDTCLTSLAKLKETCCMSERSPKITKLENSIKILGQNAQGIAHDSEEIMEATANAGAALGALYATCCTPTRVLLYQDMFADLAATHLAMLRLKPRAA